MDKWGAPVAYHFSTKHPGSLDLQSLETTRIPAFGRSGRRNILHMYFKKRPRQRRGVPFMAPIIDIMKQLGRYSESELIASVINAFLTVFITKKSIVNDLGVGAAYAAKSQSTLHPEENDADKAQIELGSGTTVELETDEDIKVVDPARPNKNFESFFLAVVKQIGAATGIPFEVLMQSFNSSYSASRAAILEFWKFVQIKRNWLIRNFTQPIFVEWLTDEVLTGRIKAEGFFTDPEMMYAWTKTQWHGTVSRGMIDPMKETRAAGERIKLKLSTHEKEFLAQSSGDWESEMIRLEKEMKTLKDRNLMPDPEPAPQPGAAAPQPGQSGKTTNTIIDDATGENK